MKCLNVLTAFLLCTMCCIAQEPYYRHFGVEDGLPSTEVYDILQDRSGFIWIATDRGVSRYDSYSFRSFSSADGLTDNTVFHLAEDAAGNIWCGTLNSKLCYFTGETIVAYKHNSALAPHWNHVMQSLDVTEAGEVLIGYQQSGCVRIDATGKYSDPLGNKDSASRFEIFMEGENYIYGSRFQNISLLIDYGLQLVRDGKRTQIVLDTKSPTYYFNVLRIQNGTVLVAINSELIEISVTGIVRHHSFNTSINELNEDTEGNIWISFRGKGVRRYPINSDFSGEDYMTFLPGETVTDVFQDSEGGYWMSTHNHGVFYLVSPNVHYLLPTGSVAVTAIASTADGRVLLGTAGGLLHTCTQGKISSTRDVNSRPDVPSFFQDIYITPDNITWIATNQNDICLSADGELNQLQAGQTRAICADGEGGVWFGGTNKLYQYSDERLQREGLIVHNTRIYEMYWDTLTETLMVGRSDGLFSLDSGQLTLYPMPEGPVTSRISAIRRMPGGELLIGTIGDGICFVKNDKQQYIGTRQGLSSSIVNDLDVDAQGNIWAATNTGLARIRQQGDSFAISCFSIYHGLPTNEIRKVLCRGDTIWIGTNNGAAWFIPRELEYVSVAPPVLIQEVLVNGEKVKINFAGNFSHDQKQVRFSFLSISYRNGGNTTYRYRLEGLDTGWIYTSNRSVEYSALPPGEYRFEVLARNGDGTWSASVASFAFEIQPPYWLTLWFWILVPALFSGVVWWLVMLRMRNIRRKAQQKTILAEYQGQALAAQMNPHFIFNSLSSMQSFVLGDDKANALRYIDRFAFLMRKSLEHSMLKFVPLEKEIELLRAYLDIEMMRFGDKITYRIICDASLTAGIQVPAMLVQPFAENAIRHGLMHREEPMGQIEISFTMKNDVLYCRVEDNGVGRARSAEINRTRRKHVSFGSSITEERLRLLCEIAGQTNSITYTDKTEENGRAAGTIVEFVIPFRKREQHAESTAH